MTRITEGRPVATVRPVWTPPASLGDLQFCWSQDLPGRLVSWFTRGPSHVRLILSPTSYCEMTRTGWRLGTLDPSEPHTRIVHTHLSVAQQGEFFVRAMAHKSAVYSRISWLADALQKLGCPLQFGLQGQLNCSMLAALALDLEDWEDARPDTVYDYYVKNGA